MAQAKLQKQITADELIQLLRIGFPAYLFTKQSPFVIVCDTGIQGLFNINISGNTVIVAPRLPGLLVLVMIITVLPLILFLILPQPISKELANYISNHYESNHSASDNTTNPLPQTCPHCRNPNTSKTRLCEWCGSQII